jgi:aspartyl/asparaginyl beta-hydroxylase (cupin superfamily)
LDASQTGWGNKPGKYLNGYKAGLKRFKRWNKPIYVTTKLLVIFSLLGLLAWQLL